MQGDEVDRRTRPAATPRRRAAGALSVVVAVVLGAAGCGSTMGLPDSATTQGEEVISLWQIFLVLAIAVTLLIWALTTYVVVSSIRRRRRGEVDHEASQTEVRFHDDDGDREPEEPVAAGDGASALAVRPPPRQHQYNTRLEIVYTAIPLALVIVLLVLAMRTTSSLTEVTPAGAGDPSVLEVRVRGFQWQWLFEYPDRKIVIAANGPDDYPELVLPVGRSVRFKLEAKDVIHSFWVPEFLEKRDLIPGVENEIEVYVKSPGHWTGRCAEYCGFNHWRMKFSVTALPADEWERWARDTAARKQPVTGTAVPR